MFTTAYFPAFYFTPDYFPTVPVAVGGQYFPRPYFLDAYFEPDYFPGTPVTPVPPTPTTQVGVVPHRLRMRPQAIPPEIHGSGWIWLPALELSGDGSVIPPPDARGNGGLHLLGAQGAGLGRSHPATMRGRGVGALPPYAIEAAGMARVRTVPVHQADRQREEDEENDLLGMIH